MAHVVPDCVEVLRTVDGDRAAEIAERLEDGPEYDVAAGLNERYVVALGEAERLADGFGYSNLAAAADAG